MLLTMKDFAPFIKLYTTLKIKVINYSSLGLLLEDNEVMCVVLLAAC